MLQEGTKAPGFLAKDQFGNEHTLANYAGSWLMLYFYPKDNTPGCTKEACAIRDAWTQFQEAGLQVLGVSRDSVVSHERFASAFSLPFPLLSDPDQTILRAYEAIGMKKMYGREYEGTLRITYLIGPDGVIAKTYPTVKPDRHAQEILRDFRTIKTSAEPG